MSRGDNSFRDINRQYLRMLAYWAIIIALACVIAFGTGCNSPKGPAVVLYKYHRPGYTYTTHMQVGKVGMPVFHRVPSSFRVLLAIKQDTLERGISFLAWDTINPGDTIILQ